MPLPDSAEYECRVSNISDGVPVADAVVNVSLTDEPHSGSRAAAKALDSIPSQGSDGVYVVQVKRTS